MRDRRLRCTPTVARRPTDGYKWRPLDARNLQSASSHIGIVSYPYCCAHFSALGERSHPHTYAPDQISSRPLPLVSFILFFLFERHDHRRRRHNAHHRRCTPIKKNKVQTNKTARPDLPQGRSVDGIIDRHSTKALKPLTRLRWHSVRYPRVPFSSAHGRHETDLNSARASASVSQTPPHKLPVIRYPVNRCAVFADIHNTILEGV